MRILVKALALSLSVGALAACSQAPVDTRAAFEVTDPGAPADTPMAQLPAAAGEQVAVVQSADHGIITQKIVLRGDAATWGENGIVVVVDQNPDHRPGEASWATPKPTESMIARELRENFADIDMGIGQTLTRNSFGPFGYALGKTSQDLTCLYAWQFAPGRPAPLISDPAVDGVTASQPAVATSVRVRLCKQHVAEADLVAMVSQMAVFPPHSTTPYLDTTYRPGGAAAPDALAATGLPGAFYRGPKTTASLEDDDVRPVKAKKKPHHKRQAHHHHKKAIVRRDADQDGSSALAPVIVPPLAGASAPSVPLAGAPSLSASSGTANPLTAPLRAVLAAKKAAAADDLPLPGADAPASAPAQSAAAAPIPLPQ